jgi:hypothetical protein
MGTSGDRMEDHFKKEDEITLAGLVKQDRELYGAEEKTGLLARLGVFLARIFGAKR